MPKRFYKYKLLLDENMPPRQRFPLLNEHYDIKHISHDLRHAGDEDSEIYKLGQTQQRIILTFNTRDFRPLINSCHPGIIGLPDAWATPKLDSKLLAILLKHRPYYFKGRVTSIGTV